jgi:SecD/SecF fusion protein
MGIFVGAAIATIHDAIILLGLFSILDGIVPFSLDIDQHFVAAILTVIVTR